jgi:hypothetical protein
VRERKGVRKREAGIEKDKEGSDRERKGVRERY